MKKVKDLNQKYKFTRPLTEIELRNLATIVKTIQDLEASIEIRMAKGQVEQYKQDKLKCEKGLVELGIEKVIKEEI